MATTPAKSTPTPPKPANPTKAAPAAPAFSLDNLTPVEAPAPRRNDSNEKAISPAVLNGLQKSWAGRKVLTEAREAVPAKDGKPAKPAVAKTELGAGLAFANLPNAEVAKTVEAQLRKGAASLSLGVSVRTEEDKDDNGKSRGTYTVRFAAKSPKNTSKEK